MKETLFEKAYFFKEKKGQMVKEPVQAMRRGEGADYSH